MTEQKIKVFGTEWCPDCHNVRKILAGFHVDYQWFDTDDDPDARLFVVSKNNGNCSVPTIVFPDGSILVEPDHSVLTAKLVSLNDHRPN